MNQLLSTVFESWTNKEVAPKADEPPKKDPLMGFEHRVERIAPLTDEQMRQARIPAQARDYCADKHVQLRKCIRQEFPLNFKCKHERHDYDLCLIEDVTYRMKEYERERRLLKREQRLKQKATS